MDTIKLKNGSEEAHVLVVTTMMSVKTLLTTHPMAVCDLVAKCKDKDYPYFGNNQKTLQDLCLCQEDGSIHGSIRNIVLSGSTGDGLDLCLCNPSAE